MVVVCGHARGRGARRDLAPDGLKSALLITPASSHSRDAVQGQTRRKVGTQNHRSKGLPRKPDDSGVASSRCARARIPRPPSRFSLDLRRLSTARSGSSRIAGENMVVKVNRSRGPDTAASGLYRRPRLVMQAKRAEDIPAILANTKNYPTPVRYRRRRLFADPLRRRRRRHDRQPERARQDRRIRRGRGAGAGRRARGRPGARPRRARSGAAAHPGDGADDGGCRGRDHAAAGLVRAGCRADVGAREGAQAGHAAGQADDRDRAQRGPDARAALELRTARRGARGGAARAAARAGENRLPGADAQGVQRAIPRDRRLARRLAAAHLALPRPDHRGAPHSRRDVASSRSGIWQIKKSVMRNVLPAFGSTVGSVLAAPGVAGAVVSGVQRALRATLAAARSVVHAMRTNGCATFRRRPGGRAIPIPCGGFRRPGFRNCSPSTSRSAGPTTSSTAIAATS